jgi:hypothetical protein
MWVALATLTLRKYVSGPIGLKGWVAPEADMERGTKRKSVPDGYQTLVIYPIAYTVYWVIPAPYLVSQTDFTPL